MRSELPWVKVIPQQHDTLEGVIADREGFGNNAFSCEPDHSEGTFGSGVAVGSRPPSEPKARKNKTSAWRPKLHSPMKFQVRCLWTWEARIKR